jgi:hypothetical protein
LKPFAEAIVMAEVTEPFWLTVPLVCARLMLKSAGAAMIVTLAGEETEAL